MAQTNKPTDTTSISTSPGSPALSAGASEAVAASKGAETKVKQAPKQAHRRMIRFGLKVPNTKGVCVVGTFNEWKPELTSLAEFGSGNWFTYLPLAPGRYEYRFVVDGKGVDEPTAREYVPNPSGGKNAVIVVQ